MGHRLVAGLDGTQLAAIASVGGTGVAAFCIHWLSERRIKTREPADGETSVVAATVISDAGIETLIRVTRDAAESHHDDCRRVRESNDDLRDAIRDLTTAVREGLPPVAGIDVIGVMSRLNKAERSRP